MSIHLQESENILQLGENLLSTCESDTGVTKKQLDTLKKKWKKLNDSKCSFIMDHMIVLKVDTWF